MRYQNREKIRIFRRLFHGLTHVYGSHDIQTGRSYQIKKPVTDKVILNHLLGKRPYGVYLLVKDKIRAIASDFDLQNRLAPMEFVSSAKHYGLDAYIERSKSKGYHVWIFFENGGVLARKARLVVRHILEEIEHIETEIFPKQDQIDESECFGNFINAPLFGSLVPKGRTVFINPTTFKPYTDQWDFLKSVSRYNEQVLDDITELNNLDQQEYDNLPINKNVGHTLLYFGLPICAQKIIQNGVTRFQRDSAFRLAVHLKRIGFPIDVNIAVLLAWSKKNQPENNKRVITEKEIIKQTEYVYHKSYRGYGCQSEAVRHFCDIKCPLNKM